MKDLLSNYAHSVVKSKVGNLYYQWVKVEEVNVYPADIYKEGVVTIIPGHCMDSPYPLKEPIQLIKGVPMGTVLFVRIKGIIREMTFYSPEEFRKLVMTQSSKQKEIKGFCLNCGIPYYELIKICENCGIKIGEVGMKS